MINFLIIRSNNPINDNELNHYQSSIKNNTSLSEFSEFTWKNKNGTVAVIILTLKMELLDSFNFYSVDSNNNLKFFCGWMNEKYSDNLIKNAKELPEYNNLHNNFNGQYMFATILNNGDGRIIRNDGSDIEIFNAKHNHIDYLSNRSIVIGDLIYKNKFIYNDYFAAGIIGFGSTISQKDTLFENVYNIPFASKIFISNQQILIEKPDGDWIMDQNLINLYHKNPRQYWDECYDSLVNSCKSFNDIPGAYDNFSLPLSGGKDSRTLFAVLYSNNLINKCLTWGKPYSPDMMSASLITGLYNINHIYNEPFESKKTIKSEPVLLNEFLYKHVFLTEGMMSPHDMIHSNKVKNQFSFHGHEFSLRNVYGNKIINNHDEAYQWFLSYHYDFDFCNILNSKIHQEIKEKFNEYFDKTKRETIPENLPIRHRKETRGRWAQRVWQIWNNITYAPFPFMTDDILKRTYNAGSVARQNEEFHFEMIKRADKKLLEIPFAQQTWNKKYNQYFNKSVNPINKTPTLDNQDLSISYKMLLSSKANIKKLINDYSGLIENVIDIDKFNKKINDISFYESPRIYNVLQVTISRLVGKNFNHLIDDNHINKLPIIFDQNKQLGKTKNIVSNIKTDKNFNDAIIYYSNNQSWHNSLSDLDLDIIKSNSKNKFLKIIIDNIISIRKNKKKIMIWRYFLIQAINNLTKLGKLVINIFVAIIPIKKERKKIRRKLMNKMRIDS